jgi:uncharacterized protein (DUF1330 family)
MTLRAFAAFATGLVLGAGGLAALSLPEARGAAATALPNLAGLADCTRPAYLVVWIDNLDRSKSAAYGEALRRTQIVASYGGEYKATGTPALLLEGSWPPGRGLVIEKYPCLEAIKRFWYSEQYQKELMPLRAGSGDYTVAAFEEYIRPAVAK